MIRGKSFCAVALAAGFSFGSLAAHADEKVHLKLDWIPTGEHAAYFAGAEKGFWKKQGIDLELSRGYGSGDTVAKMAAGAGIDFGLADIGAVLTARARTGAPVKAVAASYTHSPHSLFVLKSSGITEFKGLEGKKISITPGNSHKLYFPDVAERAGTDADKIVWVNTDASAMAALLIAKRIDAAPFYSVHHYYQNKAAQAVGEEIVVLPFEKTGFTIYAASLTTTDEMLEKKPDVVKGFLQGAIESWKWAKENQKEACELHVKRNPEVAQDDCEGSLAAALGFVFNDHSQQTGLGKFDAERLKFTWDVVAKAQELDPKWDYEQAVDTRFVP